MKRSIFSVSVAIAEIRIEKTNADILPIEAVLVVHL